MVMSAGVGRYGVFSVAIEPMIAVCLRNSSFVFIEGLIRLPLYVHTMAAITQHDRDQAGLMHL